MNITFPHHETWLYRVHPGIKLIVFSLMFFVVIVVHNPNIMFNIMCGTLILLLWSGHPWRRLLLYSLPFVLVFISTSTGMMMFGKGTTTWWSWGLIHITEESFYRGVHLGLRALTMAGIGLLFGLTTAPTNLFYSLMQSWRLPPKYAYSFLAAMRLIPILLEEFIALRQAHLIRGGTGGSKWNLYTTMKRYAIPLLAGSIRRAQRISVAMEAKGFVSEHKRTYYYIVRYSYIDIIFICYFVLMIIFSWRYGMSYPYLSITDVLF